MSLVLIVNILFEMKFLLLEHACNCHAYKLPTLNDCPHHPNSHHDISQNELYDVWETNLDFFEAVIDYYKASKVVRCYAQGGVCDIDEE